MQDFNGTQNSCYVILFFPVDRVRARCHDLIMGNRNNIIRLTRAQVSRRKTCDGNANTTENFTWPFSAIAIIIIIVIIVTIEYQTNRHRCTCPVVYTVDTIIIYHNIFNNNV